ncbi:succinate dehydrogenase [Stigmatella aurantiaca]|uniref:Succinate dehydrogenase cytochrome b558 subunit n=1 Tax=Stigmatella aurantiaca (strain DW4/3-1) TaxID=378806 RepID=Q092R8_STIAD|nr:succinate dehydrogenase [Stigmatella aurantiaca]ADO69438.1 Succinate dehydrogenase cytochrome b558 subunit [Stigmatella aurantiaca DW4/3-1]EAU66768.1 succinate dehydrogenase, cytochrome b558 subunit, putative [Stigmatella aurantiaca DW4/3-1]
MSTEAAALPRKTPLFQSRLGSFLAVVPLSFWVVNHLWDNLAAFSGAEAWEKAVTGRQDPFTQALTFFFVLAPLFMHAGWGVVRLFTFRPNNLAYNNYGNLKYILQRITAVGAFFFIGAHMWLAFLRPRVTHGGTEPFSDIAREMHYHGPTLIVYLLGTLGVAYHLANGLQNFGMAWGIFASERSMRRFEPFVIIIFLVLLAMSWGILYALYQAGAAYGPA